MMRFIEIEVAGLQRTLPLYQIDEDTSIALFVGFNDVELTVGAAEELLQRVPEFDVILTEEVQGVPLAFEMSRQALKSRYVVARKHAKTYMEDVAAIQLMESRDDTLTVSRRYISKKDAEYLENKRVLLVDDMVLKGNTLQVLSDLVDAVGGYVVGKAAIIRHQLDEEIDNLVTLITLPIYTPEGQVKEMTESNNEPTEAEEFE